VSITHFPRFPFLLPYPTSCSVCVSFSTFFCFLSKFQVLQYEFLIFHEFHCFSPYSRSDSEHFSVSMFFTVSRHIPAHTLFVSHFARFSGFVFSGFFFVVVVLFLFFLPLSSSYSVHFTFFRILGIFYFLVFAFFFFQVLQCFSPYSMSYNVCVSFSAFFGFLAIFRVLQCVFLIFHISMFLAIFQDLLCEFFIFFSFSRFIALCLQCASLIFHIFQYNSTYYRYYSVRISFSKFLIFLTIIHVLKCAFLIFHVFQCFFLIFFYFAIFQVLECVFLIFHVFQCFSPFSISFSVHSSFFRFYCFLTLFQVLKCMFLIFHGFQCSSP